MPPTTPGLVAAGAAFAFAAACAGFAAARAWRRVREGAGFGGGCLALWWSAIGVAGALRALEVLAAAAGLRDVEAFWTMRAATILCASTALGGLAAHAALLLTGDRRSVALGVLLGGCLQVGLTYALVSASEPGLWLGRWGAGVMDETEASYGAFLLVVSGPVLVVAFLYALVAARVRDRALSRRLALVSGGIATAFGALLVSQALFPEDGLVHGVLKIGGLAAGGVAVLGAYVRAERAPGQGALR